MVYRRAVTAQTPSSLRLCLTLVPALWASACSLYHTSHESRLPDAQALDASVQSAKDAGAGRDAAPDASSFSQPPSLDSGLDAAVSMPPTAALLTPMEVGALATQDPLPDCRARGFVPPTLHTRWLAFRGGKTFNEPPSVYLVQVGDQGPGKPYEIAPSFAVSPWTIGEWSDDGRYFGFVTPDPSNASFTQGSYVVDTQGKAGPDSWQPSATGTFYHWAPHRSLFALLEADGVHFLDAADHTRNTTISVNTSGYIRLVWSADGRYGAITSGGQLEVVDLDAMRLTDLAFTTGSTGAPQWAPGGHRLIFLGTGMTADNIMMVDLDDASPKPVALATADATNEGAELVTRWLDADRVLVWAPNRQMLIVSATPSSKPTQMLGTFDDQFAFLGANRCLVYAGPCLPSGATGACLMSLDANASRKPHPVFPAAHYRMVTSSAGSPVIFEDWGSQLITEARFEGAAYAPSYVTLGAAMPAFSYFSENPALAAAPEAPWVHFVARPTGSTIVQSYFWNHTQAMLTVNQEPGASFDELGVFSPDGRDYAARAHDPVQFPPTQAPLVILRPHDGGPTDQWAVQVFATGGFAEENMAWAP